MGDEQKIIHIICFMAHVEANCEEHGLLPPVEVRVRDVNGQEFDFDYNPDSDFVELWPTELELPIALELTDSRAKSVTMDLIDLAPRHEWMKPFLQ